MRRTASSISDSPTEKSRSAGGQAPQGMPARLDFGGRGRVEVSNLFGPAPGPIRPAAAEDAEGIEETGFRVRAGPISRRGGSASWPGSARPTGTPGGRPAGFRPCRSRCAAAPHPAKLDTPAVEPLLAQPADLGNDLRRGVIDRGVVFARCCHFASPSQSAR